VAVSAEHAAKALARLCRPLTTLTTPASGCACIAGPTDVRAMSLARSEPA